MTELEQYLPSSLLWAIIAISLTTIALHILHWIKEASLIKSVIVNPNFLYSNIVITGGATGIGKALIDKMSNNPCNILILDCDDKNITKNMEQWNVNKHKNCEIKFISTDLSSRQAIQQASKMVHDIFSKVDYLILNAGIISGNERKLNGEKIQFQMAVNFLGNSLVILNLLDLLKNSKDFRIISIGSIAHKFVPLDFFTKAQLDFDDFWFRNTKFHSFLGYSRSKICVSLFTQKLAEIFVQKDIKGKIICVNPGIVRSNIMKNRLVGTLKTMHGYLSPLHDFTSTISCDESAQQILFLLMQKYENIKSGQFYDLTHLDEYSQYVLNESVQNKFWQICNVSMEKELKAL